MRYDINPSATMSTGRVAGYLVEPGQVGDERADQLVIMVIRVYPPAYIDHVGLVDTCNSGRGRRVDAEYSVPSRPQPRCSTVAVGFAARNSRVHPSKCFALMTT